MESAGFGKQSGPNSSSPFFRSVAPSPPNPSSSPLRLPSPVVQSPPSWSDGQRSFESNGAQSRPRPRPSSSSSPAVVASIVASRNSENSVSLKVSRSQPDSSKNFNQAVPRRNNLAVEGFRPSSVRAVPIRQYVPPRAHTPELAYKSNHSVEGFRPSPVGAGAVRDFAPPRTHSPELIPRSNQFVDGSRLSSVEAGLASSVVPPRTRSPELGFKNSHSVAGFRPSGGASTVRPAPFSHPRDGRPKSPSNYVNMQDTQDHPSISPNIGSVDYERSQFDDVQVIDQRRSATSLSDQYSHFPQNNLKRPSLAHSSALDSTSNVNFSAHDSQASRMSLPRASNTLPEAAATIPTSFPVTKRSRSPPLLSNNQATKRNSIDIQDDEREMLAKAKRLARFKVELGEKVQSDTKELRTSTNRHEPPIVGRSKLIPENSAQLTEDFSSEHLGSEPSNVIIGLCTDMCPESERAERERKGDLDRFERLDGDRNQTSKSLAVKKYNRTAEREANLIRPMPVLQKTIKYLLNLLDQPYDDKFLATYNFLWDRMRAIRMDLRMQHIFNQGAITMLEQMIRLHIIAMHELCEYSKGEGFSEGFDSHLNIEQMNKTSVELFQMYDDHRKKGIVISTEKEFRGYYALLKLDKHPGYIVEPAELSLDLAKMTPEIRQTKEVLFARDVARACRTGNFIAFFRLARKASYLQACLMHAHFAKLRTQALASLHAGLQNNQGLPIVHVAEWLALEGEDMESLLEYHGFLIKVFDEPYMVKDGSFINGDKDYDTRRSILVETKKSGLIFEDVVPATEVTSPAKAYQSNYKGLGKKLSTTKAPKEIQIFKENEDKMKVIPSVQRKRSVHDISSVEASSPIHVVDEDMDDFEAIPSPKDHQNQPTTEMPTCSKQYEGEHQLAGFNSFSWGFSLPNEVANPWKPSFDTSFSNSSQRTTFSVGEERPLQFVPNTIVQHNLLDAPSNLVSDDPTPQELVSELEEEEPMVFLGENANKDIVADNQHEEIAEAKLKLIIRLWKRCTSRKRELREQRQLAANAAMNSLPLGLPVQLKREPPDISGEFDIDHALRERYKNHEQSWSRLNVSEEIAGTLSRRNPDAKCLCWKMIVCSQVNKPDDVELSQGSQTADLAVGTWLSSKLMPASNNDDNDLIVLSPGLSIWKNWVPGQLCTDPIYCLSVVKDVSFNDLTDAVTGASAVLFLVCESIPWNLQKAQLQRLLMSIPSGSCLPLLILSGSCKDEASDHSSIIVTELGLVDIDKSRVSSFLVVSLIENNQKECPDGFFSDTRLREGLQWLASESPSQLVLHRSKTHDLVVTHLSPSLEVLGRMKDNEVNPNDCVLAFNEAVDRSLADVDAAVKENRNSWPCPEISLLEETSVEHKFVEGSMPESGWSSAEKIEPLMSALKDCKLPLFKDDLSYLTKGSYASGEIEIQRVEFGKSLIRYLTESSKLMGFPLAIKEAGIMLQSSRLELHGSCFRIVPNWAMIFRRIFNWRLTSIDSGSLSSAYILQHPDSTPAFGDLDESGLEGSGLASYHFNQPSLDEMIEVSCRSMSLPEANQLVPRIAPNNVAEENVAASDLMEDDHGVGRDCRQVVAENGVREVVTAGKSKEEADRLSKLLEKCNILQNMIDEKLSVYF